MFNLGKAIHTRKMISYCGLYCRECPAYTREISFLANELRNELDNYKSNGLAHKISLLKENLNEIGNYDQFYIVLKNLEKLSCGAICREGGGSINCSIKKCCKNKMLEGCWDCYELESCRTLDDAKPTCEKSNTENLIQIRDHGVESFLGLKEA